MASTVQVVPDHHSFQRVATALAAEANGGARQREIVEAFTKILEKVRSEQRAGLMAMSSSGLPHAGEPLREAISAGLEVDVRLGGRFAGARIKATKHGMPRSFVNAAKRTNAKQWRHRVYGRDVWVTQISGAEGWFDRPIDLHGAKFRAAARRVLDNAALRIDRKT